MMHQTTAYICMMINALLLSACSQGEDSFQSSMSIFTGKSEQLNGKIIEKEHRSNQFQSDIDTSVLMGIADQPIGFHPNPMRGKTIAEKNCASCHGIDGNTNVGIYPKLAGRNIAYLIRYITRIQKGTRTSGNAAMMRPMVLSLSEQDIIDVAAYYEQQIPKVGEANPNKNIELGEKIYRTGLPEKHIPPCMACHGPNGAGTPAGRVGVDGKDGTAGSPRLSGQNAEYLVIQLRAYQNETRHSPKMYDITQRMDEQDMDAVANYIQGLH